MAGASPYRIPVYVYEARRPGVAPADAFGEHPTMKMRLTLSLVAFGTVVAVAFAHVDDPKVRDAQPAIPGPIYRASEGGTAGAFDANGILLKSWIPLNNFSGSPANGNDCWGYVSPSGREYAIMGLNVGTAFVEVTDPANAQIVGQITGPTSLWRCMKVYGAYCYAGSEGGGGIQVIDMTNIDGTNTSLPRVSLATTVTTGGTSLATHTLAIDTTSGFLYRAGGGSNGIRIYDVATNPANPTFVGQWNNVYVHEAQVVTYTSGAYAGKQIAFCCGGSNGGNVNTGLYIVDVTNKAAPVQLSYTTYPNARYCHQSWLSNDGRYVYINDELDEGATVSVTSTIVMDVRTLTAPTVVGAFTNGNPAVGHNLYIKGTKLFEANYRSGLRVFDLAASATNPPEVAFFDTWPGDDNANFNGLWNVWPYFPSGTFIGSDIERGLFVWRFGAPAAAFSYPNGRPSLVAPVGGTVTVQAVPAAGTTLPAGSVKLVTTVDGVLTETVMQPLGGNLYRGTFPSIACTKSFTYNVRVDAADGPYPDPSGPYAAIAAAGITTAVDDTCEAQGGWQLSATGDNATAGLWINADPVGTAAQPEDDRTPAPGTRCFVTGNGAVGGSVGAADVDGGSTTLTSPPFDATNPETRVSYWYWYSNNQGSAPNEDSMPVQVSANGTTWVQVDLISTNAGAWTNRTFRIADFVAGSAATRVRWVARDLGTGSVVEAAVDDVQVIRYDCTSFVAEDFNRDGRVDGADLGTLLGSWGLAGSTDLTGDGITNGADLAQLLAAWTP